MKQRISVRAVIRSGDKVLLLRRAAGRPEVVGRYELPGGSLDSGEQPTDAIVRQVERATGLRVQSAQLTDVVSSNSPDDIAVQYISIVYTVNLKQAKIKIDLSQNYDHYHWDLIQNIQQEQLTEVTQQLLHLIHHTENDVIKTAVSNTDDKYTTDMLHLIVYSDGGSRGNPGPSAAGFVAMDENEQVIHEGGLYLGITTNNQAEYHGVQLGLEKALELGARRVDFRMDSMLVVNQMNGIYTIKNRELWPINERIHELVAQFEKVTFTHVKREFNQLADGMVNKILNAHAKE